MNGEPVTGGQRFMATRLRFRLILYSVLGALITGAATSLVSVVPLLQTIRNDQFERLVHSAVVEVMAIEEFVQRSSDTGAQISSRTKARESLESFNDGIIDHDELVLFSAPILGDAMRQSPEIAGITRLDNAGQLAVTVGRTVPRPLWPPLDADAARVHPPISVAGRTYVLVSSPIYDRAQERVGHDLVLFEMSGLQSLVEGARGESVRVALGAHQNGEVQRFFGDDLSPAIATSEHNVAIERAIAGQSGIYETGTGERWNIAYRPIANADWGLAVAMPHTALFASMRRLLVTIIGLIVVLSAAAAFGVYRLVRPLAGKLIIHADELEQEIEHKNRALRTELEAREQMEAELHTAKQRAETANQAKSDFLSTMSHEIRTPMNAVIGLSRLALATNLNAKQHDYLTKIDISARLLLQIINDILDVSKIESGKLELEQVPFPVEPLVAEVGTVLQSRTEAKGLELILSIEPGAPASLVGDPLRLKQILLNLANNAVKFTDRGEVVIRVAVESRDEGTATMHFSVRDSGIGIEPDRVPQLFQPFTQADSSTSRRFGGTGLGLTICKQLVTMMGGRIWVESEPLRGSTFHFTAQLELAGDAEPVDKALLPIAGQSVLLAVANLQLRRTLEEQLEALRLRCVGIASFGPAENANVDALQSAQSFALHIVDWELPPRGGIDAIERMTKSTGNTPSILLAPCGREQDVYETARGHGIEHLLYKPFTPSMLFDAIVTALGQERCADLSLAPEATQLTASRAKLQGAKVLLVEDNYINQQVAVELLAQVDVTCDVVDNGAEAVHMVCLPNSDYQAVLMDIEMPVLDGLEATRAIRRARDHNDLPIIALTAQVLSGDRERSLAAGINDHIGKPIEPQLLYDVLTRWVTGEPGETREPGEPREPARDQADHTAEESPEHALDSADGLRRVGGNTQVYRELLQDSRRDWHATGGELREALGAGDNASAVRTAHTVKGVAANLGVTLLASAAGKLEQGIRAAGPNVESGLVVDFEQALDQAIAAIDNWMEEA